MLDPEYSPEYSGLNLEKQMGFLISVPDTVSLGEGVWLAKLKPADVLRLGNCRTSLGSKSIILANAPRLGEPSGNLSFSPEETTVLNVGSGDQALIVDIERIKVGQSPLAIAHAESDSDTAFLVSCRRLLNPSLVVLIERLLKELRESFPGILREGKARKWVNHPGNFLAITIQPRDGSFAIHVKGQPTDFVASTLDIKPDRPSYSRFKLKSADEIDDAIDVVLKSARNSNPTILDI